MPLFARQPFQRRQPPANLKPDSKVFFCEVTGEVFTDYDEYWERLVLCNAMLWTCELTGRPNLTYLEAVESEMRAKKFLSNFPKNLRMPLLYLATLTKRGRCIDMSDDIFLYARDRYFLGEEVEAIIHKHWYDCKVVRVIYPKEEDIAKYEEDIADTDEEEQEVPLENGDIDKPKFVDSEGNTVEENKVEVNVKKEEQKDKNIPKKTEDYPPFATFKYEVEELEPWDYKQVKRHIVPWEQIRRNKGVLTREKCKLFIKQCAKLSSTGFWTVKDSVITRYDLTNLKFSSFFVGEPPQFVETRAKKMPTSLSPRSQLKEDKEERKQARKRDNKENGGGGEVKRKGRAVLSQEEKEERKKMRKLKREGEKDGYTQLTLGGGGNGNLELMNKEAEKDKLKEELRLKLEQEKAEKKREREIVKEERRLLIMYMKEWRRVREDQDCEDLKDLPEATPVSCRIPNALFGDFMMMLEFLNVFADLTDMKNCFPQGITFDMLEHALVENEVAGVLNDILQLLLGCIFNFQEEELEEMEADKDVADGVAMDFEGGTGDVSKKEAVRIANRAATWCQLYQGLPLRKMHLDPLTLTEVLRLHLLASGSENDRNARWSYFNRGGYDNLDDPGLQLKLDDPWIIKALTSHTVFSLSVEGKLKVLITLANQVLTYASARDVLDENIEKIKEKKNVLRLHQLAEIRKDKEENAARIQQKREAKQKEREKLLKEAERKAQTMAGVVEDSNVKQEEELEDEVEDEEEKKARQEKEDKIREKRKQVFMRREGELMEEVLDLAMGVNMTALGQDRAYRSYWVFNSLPGLYVEDDEQNPGICRDHPIIGKEESDVFESEEMKKKIRYEAMRNLQFIKEENDDTDKNNSDKENDSTSSPVKSVKTVVCKTLLKSSNQSCQTKCFEEVSEQGGADSEKKMDSEILQDAIIKSEDLSGEPIRNVFGICTANLENCPVHNVSLKKTKWLFYHKVEDFESLRNNLNERGVRESDLKTKLLRLGSKVENSIKICPVYKLDPSQEPELERMSRKSQRNTGRKEEDANLNFPPGTPIDEIVELTLRDLILELEEKLYLGSLGSLKAHSRDEWREAIVQRAYERQADELDWGGRRRINKFKEELGPNAQDMLDLEDLTSEDPVVRDEKLNVVKTLAQALLQVAQAIETKYLRPPLVEKDKEKSRRERLEKKLQEIASKEKGKEAGNEAEESDEENGEEEMGKIKVNSLRTPLERWEQSLMSSTTFSQVCLHLTNLDNSISWSRSALNAQCRLCRRKKDPESMLLCDGCNKGHHMYCLKPKLKSVPNGDWFCDICKPKEKPKSPKKNRKIYQEESDEDDQLEQEQLEEEEEESGAENEDVCDVCEKGGTLLCCDTCPRAFHQECIQMERIPRGNWSCRYCRGLEENVTEKAEQKKKTSVVQEGKKEEKSSNNKKKKSSKKSKKDKKEVPQDKKSETKKSKIKSQPPANKTTEKETSKEKNSKKRKTEEADFFKDEKSLYKPAGEKRRRSAVDADSWLNVVALDSLLSEMCKHEDGWPFLRPVSKKDAPDYFDIVKKPMDFGTMRGKLGEFQYKSDSEFIADCLLIFQNCQQYNMEDTPQYKAGMRLSQFLMKRIQELGLKYRNEWGISVNKKSRRSI